MPEKSAGAAVSTIILEGFGEYELSQPIAVLPNPKSIRSVVSHLQLVMYCFSSGELRACVQAVVE